MARETRRLLRHQLATLAYRTRKSLQGAPTDFGAFAAGSGVRTPQELVNHMSNLIAFTVSALRDEERVMLPETPDFGQEVARLHRLLGELASLLDRVPLAEELSERLLQGPLSDAMTHVGQLALLRRLAGSPVAAENFFTARIGASDLSGTNPA